MAEAMCGSGTAAALGRYCLCPPTAHQKTRPFLQVDRGTPVASALSQAATASTATAASGETAKISKKKKEKKVGAPHQSGGQ